MFAKEFSDSALAVIDATAQKGCGTKLGAQMAHPVLSLFLKPTVVPSAKCGNVNFSCDSVNHKIDEIFLAQSTGALRIRNVAVILLDRQPLQVLQGAEWTLRMHRIPFVVIHSSVLIEKVSAVELLFYEGYRIFPLNISQNARIALDLLELSRVAHGLDRPEAYKHESIRPDDIRHSTDILAIKTL